MELELYKNRPGFQVPYEGPTKLAEEDPEGWEEMTLRQQLAHRLKKFTDEEALVEGTS